MKKTTNQKRYLILGLLVLFIIAGLRVWYFSSSKPMNRNFSKKEQTWKIAEVKMAKDFTSIKIPAKAKSNQFAIISPRRTGIIQDLLVDIGDEVYKGQPIGLMLPEGVEGQGSAAINEASARLQKARAELSNIKGVAVDSVSVATKQWQESNLQTQTQAALDQETQKQLVEKKMEALLIATQAWENTKLILFGNGTNRGSRDIRGNFSDSIQENDVENLADEIQRMEESEQWDNPEKVVEHLSHLEKFLVEAEMLYKNAREGGGITASQLSSSLRTIQSQQLNISQIKQSILALEEKRKRFSSIQAEREAGADRSREVLDLVQSQQNLATTQAEKNVEVAFANYNAALVKAGHQSVTSPFDGTITARMVEVGQAVTPNTALFYLEGAQTARSQESLSEIHFSLPESWQNKVMLGDMVVIKTMDGESFEGKIFRLSEQIDIRTNSIMATATAFDRTSEIETETESKEMINSIAFTHGQSLFVSITASQSSVFTVPTLALKKRSNQYFIWKIEEENLQQIQVEVVAEDGEFSQVFSRELQSGEAIITNPSITLFKKSE